MFSCTTCKRKKKKNLNVPLQFGFGLNQPLLKDTAQPITAYFAVKMHCYDAIHFQKYRISISFMSTLRKHCDLED